MQITICIFILSGLSNVFWIGLKTPEQVDSYFLSPTSWATVRIFIHLILDQGQHSVRLLQGGLGRHGPHRGKGPWCQSLCSFKGLLQGNLNRLNHASLPLEIILLYFHQILSQRPCQLRPERKLLPPFVAAQQVMPHSNLAPGKKTQGHYFGNHLDGVCQNHLTP